MSKYVRRCSTMAALGGLIVALSDYFMCSSGIDHTGGALLVAASTLVLLAMSLAAPQLTRGWRVTFRVLCAIDIVATGVAAAFLHAWWLLIFMVFAAVGWILSANPRITSQRASGLQGMSS